LTLSKEEIAHRDYAVDQSWRLSGNRYRPIRSDEPVIQREGPTRYSDPAPGIQDTERARRVTARTALLEFKWYDDTVNVEDGLRNDRPPAVRSYMVTPAREKKGVGRGRIPSGGSAHAD